MIARWGLLDVVKIGHTNRVALHCESYVSFSQIRHELAFTSTAKVGSAWNYVESGEHRTFGPDCDGRPRLAM